MKNREIVSSLFFRRTGIKYQNWIQAWAVTKLQKQKVGNTKYHRNKISCLTKNDD
tara:strand:+ start:275 stop:439 length:165 start_codon:yes stop_codon:yes gene_type:complete